MSFVCVWIPEWRTDTSSITVSGRRRPRTAGGPELPAALLAVASHVVVEEARGMIWVDARGLNAADTGRRALEAARRYGAAMARVGVASTPIAAEVAAICGHAPLVTVPVGLDVTFLTPFPLAVLTPSSGLAAALDRANLWTCGDLARLTHQAVEAQFGTEGVALWRLARADDPRPIFVPKSPTLPSASLAWEAHVRDSQQLFFVANRLVATVCAELRSWGETARAVTVGLTRADRVTVEWPLRARGTARRTLWMRLVRRELRRVSYSGGVVGLSVRVDATGAALARHQPPTASAPIPPRPLRRDPMALATTWHRDQRVPARFRTPEGHETELLTAISPDRGSGGAEVGAPSGREYFTCLTGNGLLVLLVRDVVTDAWYLQGWWD